MQYPATLVTALYDIGRGQMKKEANNHRPFSAYLDWFKHLLHVNAPLVVFIPPQGNYSGGYDLQKFIQDNRPPGYPTLVIIKPFTSLPLYSKKEKINQVMTRLNHPNLNLEFHHPDYILIIYSKFDFLGEVMASNPYKSQYFFWVDAGYFRNPPGEEINLPWPDKEKLDSLEGRFLLQNHNQEYNKKLHSEKSLHLTSAEKDYLKKCPNEVIACFFGGQEKIVATISEQCLALLDEMLTENLINNEQQALSLLIYREPEKFLLYPANKDSRHLLIDLSTSGYLKTGYAKCPHLKAFTVVTREIKGDDFKAWEDTAKYYGYNYEILGRDEKWNGWPYRTQKYLDALKSLNPEIKVVILADGTDLFFCGSSWEAYRKFMGNKYPQEEDIIIGVENIIAYKESSGRHTSYQIEEFFIQQCQSRFCFPNGGFIIGRVPALIKLLEANLISNDDQAGYMDLLYEKKITYTRDEKNVFVANIPNYNTYTNRDVGFWKWDPTCHRYYNPHTKEYPIALHFPGKNTLVQTRMLQEVVPQNRQERQEIQSSSWVWWILIGLSLLFMIGIFWNFRCYVYKVC